MTLNLSSTGPLRRGADTLPSRIFHAAAIILILSVLGARSFLPETPFRHSDLRAFLGTTQDPGSPEHPGFERIELGRVTFAVLLLTGLACWLIAEAMRGSLVITHPTILVLILLFAALSSISAFRASDQRSAWNCWIEQLSLLLGAFLVAQLASQPRLLALVVVVVAGVGLTLGVKGLWETTVEIPERIADFEAHIEDRIRQAGLTPETPHARIFAARFRASTPLGYFNLSNIYASYLLLAFPVALGLTLDKLTTAMRQRKQFRKTHEPATIHPPTLSGTLTAILTITLTIALVLTRSRGAILSAILVLIGGTAVYVFRDWLIRHRKKALIIVSAILVIGLTTLITYAVKHDSLPTKTMTFRWYYWTRSARIIAERPLLGTGPGNFGHAYLRGRRPGAEEAVKAPHNFALHALTQFGIVGGLCYIAILASMLVRGTRPSREPPAGNATSFSKTLLTTVPFILGAMICSRVLLGGIAPNPFLIFLEVILPAIVLGAMLLLSGWSANSAGNSWYRLGLACATAGFLLHNMVTFSLWTPGTAMVFFVCCGAVLGQVPSHRWSLTSIRWAGVVLGLVAVALAGWWFWKPVYTRTLLSERMRRQIRKGAITDAIRFAEQSAQSDSLDPLSAIEAADLIRWTAPRADKALLHNRMEQAYRWAQVGIQRDPENPSHHHRAAMIAWYLSSPDEYRYRWVRGIGNIEKREEELQKKLNMNPSDTLLLSDLAAIAYAKGDYREAARLCKLALRYDTNSPTLHAHLARACWKDGQKDKARIAWSRAAKLITTDQYTDKALSRLGEAVHLNPMSIQLRLLYAHILCTTNRPDKALDQLQKVEELDRQLLPGSLMRLTESDRDEISILRARVNTLGDEQRSKN